MSLATGSHLGLYEIVDGKRFLGLTSAGGQSLADAGHPVQIQVVLNWFEELRHRVPAK